jgi:hypothetical protein
MLHRDVSFKLTDVSEVLSASTIRVMTALIIEASNSSETWVSFYETTWHNISDNHLLSYTDLTDPNGLYSEPMSLS